MTLRLAATAAAAVRTDPPPNTAPESSPVAAIFPTGPSRALGGLRLVSVTLLLGACVAALQDAPGVVALLAAFAAAWLASRGRRGALLTGTLVLHEDGSLIWFGDSGVRGGPLEPTAAVGWAGVLFLAALLEGQPRWFCLSRAESHPGHWRALQRWMVWRHRGGKPAGAALESVNSALS